MLDFLKSIDFSAGGRALIAGMFSATTCYMFIQQIDIPAELMLINGVVVVDYFRSKQQERMNGIGVPAENLPKPFIPGGA